MDANTDATQLRDVTEAIHAATRAELEKIAEQAWQMIHSANSIAVEKLRQQFLAIRKER